MLLYSTPVPLLLFVLNKPEICFIIATSTKTWLRKQKDEPLSRNMSLGKL